MPHFLSSTVILVLLFRNCYYLTRDTLYLFLIKKGKILLNDLDIIISKRNVIKDLL